MTASSPLNVSQALLKHYSRIDTVKAEPILFDPDNGIKHTDLSDSIRQSDGGTLKPRALYIKVPFCPVRCLHCDNETVITHDPSRIDRYLDGLENEIALLAGTIGTKPYLQQLHLGGGSPNYLNDTQLVRLMGIVDDHFATDDDTQASLEANPRTTSPSQLSLLYGLGFDQIKFSLGDLDPAVQLAIGKSMSVDMVRDVFDTARDVGFTSVGTDIRYGLPCQTSAGIRRTIDSILSLAPDRIACSAFSRHATLRAHQRGIDRCTMPSLGDKMALFNAIVEGLSGDYEWIGLDSFAKADDALTVAQAENRLYKSYIGYSDKPTSDIHGVGTSAISDLEHICVQNHVDQTPWQQAIAANELPVRGGIQLSRSHRAQRNALRALICNMELDDYAPLIGTDEQSEETWGKYARDGLVAISAGAMKVTNEGRFLLPHLLAS